MAHIDPLLSVSTAASTPSLGTGMSSRSSLNVAGSKMQRTVSRTGLSLGFRSSFVNEIAIKLQQEGYCTRESLFELSDEQFARLAAIKAG